MKNTYVPHVHAQGGITCILAAPTCEHAWWGLVRLVSMRDEGLFDLWACVMRAHLYVVSSNLWACVMWVSCCGLVASGKCTGSPDPACLRPARVSGMAGDRFNRTCIYTHVFMLFILLFCAHTLAAEISSSHVEVSCGCSDLVSYWPSLHFYVSSSYIPLFICVASKQAFVLLSLNPMFTIAAGFVFGSKTRTQMTLHDSKLTLALTKDPRRHCMTASWHSY
jgi:hypothetical protein